MSFCEQLQKLGPVLLGKAIWGEKECPPGLNKGGGEKREILFLLTPSLWAVRDTLPTPLGTIPQ